MFIPIKLKIIEIAKLFQSDLRVTSMIIDYELIMNELRSIP